MTIEDNLKKMGVTLPRPPAPAGSYVPVAVSDSLAFVSGQIPVADGALVHTGRVGESNVAEAKKSARLCAINVLAQLRAALGSLERVGRVLRINGFVNSEPDFTAHPKVIDAASDFFYEVFGESGRHSRIAVGVQSLPFGAMTEIDAVVEIRP